MKRNFFIFCFLLIAVGLPAQSYLPADTLKARILRQTEAFPQEKIYLSTDKNAYVAGESLWFRSFVVDALSHHPVSMSRYVYVELINPFDSVVSRVMIRPDNLGLHHGHINLNGELPEGDYMLRAYTRYMCNQDTYSFFNKKISIASPLSRSVCIEASYQPNTNNSKNETQLSLGLLNVSNRNVSDINSYSVSRRGKTVSVKRSEKKLFLIAHPGETLLVNMGNYRKYLLVPQPVETGYHVDFLPEGGNLVSGRLCRIAFKSLNSAGQSEFIRGTIVNEHGDTLTRFKTFHRGMGSFSFIPQWSRKYFAICENRQGLTQRYELPEARKGIASLNVNQSKEQLYVSVTYDSVFSCDSLLLVALQRGHPLYVSYWNKNEPYLRFDSKSFSSGIIHFILCHTNGQILSERLSFILNHDQAGISVSPDRLVYHPKEKVNIRLSLTDETGVTADGDCSVSVTNDKDVSVDTCTTIGSTLLLTSDLHGFIEDPNWYFRERGTKESQHALDLVMMTHGWRRYDLPAIIRGDYQFPSILAESSMCLSGSVHSALLNKPLSGCEVRIMSPLVGLSESLSTDGQGKFRFSPFEFPDSTKYIVSAFSSKGKDNVVLKLDTISFPPVTKMLNPDILPEVKKNEIGNPIEKDKFPVSYLMKASDKIAYEKGMQHVFLDEVTVTGRYKPAYQTEFEIVANVVIGEKQIKESNIHQLGTLVAALGGVSPVGNNIFFRGSQVLLAIDGIRIENEDSPRFWEYFNVSDIEQIDIIKGQASCLGFFDGRAGCIIAVTTKRGIADTPFQITNMGAVMPLGYQQPVEFYSPHYEPTAQSDDKPDLRTTLYWKPNVITRNGAASFSFYTASSQGLYSILIEGITKEGKTFRTLKRLVIELPDLIN